MDKRHIHSFQTVVETSTTTDLDDGSLISSERLWAEMYEDIRDSGYLLRRRYRPGWTPQWANKADSIYSEMAIRPLRWNCLDAGRIVDGVKVWLKYVPCDSPEHHVGLLLRSDVFRQDRRNHAVELLDVIRLTKDPKHVVLVYPLLRRIDSPPLTKVAECFEFIGQMLEGLAFLHEHEIAHRDCNWENIMMDASKMYPEGWHPQRIYLDPSGNRPLRTRPTRKSVGGVKYLFIDFEFATVKRPSVLGIVGQVRAPELSRDVPYNPYKLDVYMLGKGCHNLFFQRHSNLQPLLPLVESMIAFNPHNRPTASEALSRFVTIQQQMSLEDLSKPIRPLEKSIHTRGKSWRPSVALRGLFS